MSHSDFRGCIKYLDLLDARYTGLKILEVGQAYIYFYVLVEVYDLQDMNTV